MTDDQLREMVRKARAITQPVGSMHGYWDLISDAEIYLDSSRYPHARPMMSRLELEAWFIQNLGEPK